MSRYMRIYDSEEFNSYEEAFDAAKEEMDTFDLAFHFNEFVNFDELFEWALKHEDFYECFDKELNRAEVNYFEANFIEIEKKEE